LEEWLLKFSASATLKGWVFFFSLLPFAFYFIFLLSRTCVAILFDATPYCLGGWEFDTPQMTEVITREMLGVHPLFHPCMYFYFLNK